MEDCIKILVLKEQDNANLSDSLMIVISFLKKYSNYLLLVICLF
jgi:hypothetical protein